MVCICRIISAAPVLLFFTYSFLQLVGTANKRRQMSTTMEASEACTPCLAHDKKWRGLYQSCLNGFYKKKVKPDKKKSWDYGQRYSVQNEKKSSYQPEADETKLVLEGAHLRLLTQVLCSCKAYPHPTLILGQRIAQLKKQPASIEQLCEKLLIKLETNQALLAKMKLLLVPLMSGTFESAIQYSSHVKFLLILNSLLENDETVLESQSEEEVEKDNVTHSFTLPIPSELVCQLGLLIGAKGHHLKPICDQYKCSLSLMPKWEPSRGHILEVVVRKVTAEVANKVISQLEKHVSKIGEKIRFVQHKSQQYFKVKMMQREMVDVSLKDYKEAARETYSTKQKHCIKHKHKTHCVLETGSRCMNCLEPYNKRSSCTYHPGYLVCKTNREANRQVSTENLLKWTCCDATVNGSDMGHQQEAHLNGCCKGVPCWRLTKSSKAGHKTGSGWRGSRPRKDSDNLILSGDRSALHVIANLEDISI